eukprot:TRINITY_DN19416_c0_g1_i1.p1 TRINITY_DN19416_c0_g1~~TRINITY_DN19416_c0_g1_i1.p1  ORF type:complete len:240 (-),score=83.69 TRINITY_DN19416_c0_g1_i1:198-917(-)
MDLKNKEEFEFFMQRALASFSEGTNLDDNYIELYNILLRAFAVADTDYDGQVSIEEFESMIEAAAALPRKFGYNWWEEEKCVDDAAKSKNCEDFFTRIDDNGDGSITFDEWLGFALKHYQEKGSQIPVAFDAADKESFVATCKESTKEGSAAFKAVYWFQWKCFQAADSDRDGMVSADEFDKMIEMATSNQKRLGMPVPFSTAEERAATFKSMDENGDESISFDEWLAFSNKEIISQVA